MSPAGKPIDAVVPVKDEFEKLALCCSALRAFIPIKSLIIATANTSSRSIKMVRTLADIPVFDESAIGAGRVRKLGLSNVETEFYASVDADVVLSKDWYPW